MTKINKTNISIQKALEARYFSELVLRLFIRTPLFTNEVFRRIIISPNKMIRIKIFIVSRLKKYSKIGTLKVTAKKAKLK